MAKLHLDISEGDSVRVGDALITLERKVGKKSRFRIEADNSVKVELLKIPRKSEGLIDLNTRMSATENTGKNSWQEQSLGLTTP
jgi:hypothetical protein